MVFISFASRFFGTACEHDTQRMASDRRAHRLGEDHQGATATVRGMAKSFSAVSSAWEHSSACSPTSPERKFEAYTAGSRDDNRAGALAKIARNQASIQVLGTEDTEELHVLKESLKKAENAGKIPPPQVQIDHALEFIKRARKRLESADDKIAKAAQALRFAQEEKELDLKGIAESEALVKRLREEVDNILWSTCRVWEDRDTSCAVCGGRIGQEAWNLARNAFERIMSRCARKILSSGWPTVRRICKRPC